MAFGTSRAFSFGIRSIGTVGLYLTLSQRFFLDTRLLDPIDELSFRIIFERSNLRILTICSGALACILHRHTF
jgi:hypothetical protein